MLNKLAILLGWKNIIENLSESLLEEFLAILATKNASGCQLASVGPRNLTKMIKFYIVSMGMGFDYSNTPY